MTNAFSDSPRSVSADYRFLRLLIVAAMTFVPPAAIGADQERADEIGSPLSPEQSLKHLVLPDGIHAELVACEPQIVDPVAFAFDEKFQLWVVEMRDYPNGPSDGMPPRSRIKLLLDKDRNGFYETAHTFADELLFATGILPWNGGVIVTLAGEVIWLKDTDGDFKADVREPWFRGFSQDNPQLRANHPTLGPDNWIYIANGLRGGKVIAVKPEWADKAQPVDISRKDFRFNPLIGEYEAITGTGQFGLTFNQLGERFVCSNRNPSIQIVFEDRYLRRNPHLAISSAVHDAVTSGADSRIFPISNAWTTSNLHAGQFTAACGVTSFHGFGLPADYQNNIFTCDPTGNLVHRSVLTGRDGVLIQSRSAREGVEFLASRDEWFRPVNLYCGPGGALYVADMYRAVIEHPQWVPDELKNRPDQDLGNDKGRIYRLSSVAAESKPVVAEQIHSGDQADVANWHDSPWQSETVRRLWLEQSAKTPIEQLTRAIKRARQRPDEFDPDGTLQLLRSANKPSPSGLSEKMIAALFSALDRSGKESVPLSRELIRHSETFLKDKGTAKPHVLAAVAHSSAIVRFQAALSLGESELDDTTIDALASIAIRDARHETHRTAVLCSARDRAVDVFTRFWTNTRQTNSWNNPGVREFAEQVSRLVRAAGKEEAISRLWSLIADTYESQTEPAKDSNPKRSTAETLVWFAALSRIFNQSLPNRSAKEIRLDQSLMRDLSRQANELAFDAEQTAATRLQAIAWIANEAKTSPDNVRSLTRLFSDESDSRLRVAALQGLTGSSDETTNRLLLDGYPSESPTIRRSILDVLIADSQGAESVLTAIADSQIPLAEIDPSRRSRLLKRLKGAQKQRAQKLFAAAIPDDRKEVLARYRPVVDLAGDAKRGMQIFKKQCSTCHRVGTVGVNVAPDISDSRNKKVDYYLLSILDPNRAVDANYFGYAVVTNEGRIFSGVISSETTTSITIVQPEGKKITLLRSEIELLKNTGISLMPVGLEKNIQLQDMADVIAYIKDWRYLDGRIPLGRDK